MTLVKYLINSADSFVLFNLLEITVYADPFCRLFFHVLSSSLFNLTDKPIGMFPGESTIVIHCHLASNDVLNPFFTVLFSNF